MSLSARCKRYRVKLYAWRARRGLSLQYWERHRKELEAAARFDEDQELETQCAEIRKFVTRLEIAADVGSQEARHRLRRLRLDPIGAEAARAAGEALRRLDLKMMAKG